jgi:uncharacterized glyoxalase superfamily protein PhnB
MKGNRSNPPSSVIPVLVYPDVRAAVTWLAAAFGFAERVRIGDSHRAQMSVGGGGAMIVADVRGEQPPPQPGTVTHVIKVRVEDVETLFELAQSAGARIIVPPTNPQYGERECTVEDLAGHHWQFTQTLRDVAPEDYGCETVGPGWTHPRVDG